MKLGKKKLQELKNGTFQFEKLRDRYFIDSKNLIEDDNIFALLNNDVCSFQDIVDKFKSMGENTFKEGFLWDEELFETLIENNKLTNDDLRYLLNTLTNWEELENLCSFNPPLIKHILNEFVLDKEIVEKSIELLSDPDIYYWLKERNVRDIFDLIEHEATHKGGAKTPESEIDKKLLELNELNKTIYFLNSFELTKKQRDELKILVQDNEVAKNKLIQIIENNLESTFDFDSLMQYLKKPEKRNIMNI